VEAVGASWETSRGISVNVTFPDGRVVVCWVDAAPHATVGADGSHRVFGGGPLRLECVDPYRHWRIVFDGRGVVTTSADQLAGQRQRDPSADGAEVAEVAIEIDAQMSVPAWLSGSLDCDGKRPEGEIRYQQLASAQGVVGIDGTETPFAGGSLRVHRKGGNRSDYSTWRGHVWQSAVFPSGRAFGFCHYGPYPDGTVRYREGYVFHSGTLIPAKVVDTPWMTTLQTSGQDVSFGLESSAGVAHIEAVTTQSTFSLAGPIGPLQQGIARYRWDGEEAYGMIERSYPGATAP
jgi:hypothetical protein